MLSVNIKVLWLAYYDCNIDVMPLNLFKELQTI